MMRKTVCVVLLATCLAACGSTPQEDTYYSLVLDAASNAAVWSNDAVDITVNLARIELPSFLDSRAMAMQTGPNEVRAARHHFWAEALDESIAKVLVRDITQSASTVDIERDRRWGADCELSVEFDRFHATDDGRALASGRYWITSEVGSRKREFDVSRRLTVNGYSAAVSTLRESLRSVAGEIAREIDNSGICQTAELAG